MNLKFENNLLKLIDPKITSADTTLTLQSDIEAPSIFGILILTNGVKKFIDFTLIDGIYKGRLVITSDELPYVKTSKFQLVFIDNEMEQKTNFVSFQYNIELIKKDIRLKVSDELEKLNVSIKKLESVVDSILTSKVIKELKVQNKDYIRPGMIPVAIDANGNCVMSYPFSNHIVEVNGQKATNGVVTVDASMIKYNLGKSVETSLDEHAEAIASIGAALLEISNSLKDIRQHIDEVDIRLSQHINNGII